MKFKCFHCIWLMSMLVVLMFGCSKAMQSVDYYNECLNDPQCVQEMATVRSSTNAVVTSSIDASGGNSSIAQLVGAIAGSVIAFGVGVQRGKKIKKD